MRVVSTLLAGTLAVPAAAQSFPQRPIRVVIGFPAGGGIDVVARLLAPRLTESLGQQVIVDNRPGANGIVATEIVARANADGHTLFFGTTGNLAVNPVLQPKLSFDIKRDFAPLMQVASVPFLLYAHPGIPAKNVAELVALVKSQPGKINFYSSGTGGLPHLAGELFNTLAAMRAVHVPYKGSAPGFNDLLGGHVHFGFDAVPTGLQHVRAGRVRALATTAPQRLSFLPDVPAAREALPGLDVVNWYGLVVPAGTPGATIARLHKDIAAALAVGEIREKMVAQATDPVESDPRSFAAFLDSEMAKWAGVVKQAGVKPQ